MALGLLVVGAGVTGPPARGPAPAMGGDGPPAVAAPAGADTRYGTRTDGWLPRQAAPAARPAAGQVPRADAERARTGPLAPGKPGAAHAVGRGEPPVPGPDGAGIRYGPGPAEGRVRPAAGHRPDAGEALAHSATRPPGTVRERSAPAAGRADGGTGRSWPVGAPRPVVVRGWDPPSSPYAAGHRGVDLAAGPGTAVRAAARGRVVFAGRVAGRGVLSIALTGTGDPPLRITYEPVRPLVAAGDEVVAGQAVATLEPGGTHCPVSCLHWGLLRGDAYLDPLSLLPPWMLRRAPSRLLPVLTVG